jgi:phage gp36-like protein
MYCSIEDVTKQLDEDSLIKLSSEDNEVDDDIVKECISDADSFIDGYLRKIYPVPLDPVPQIVKKLSVTIAISYLYDKRTIHDEGVVRLYDNAEKLLLRISKRQVDIGYSLQEDETAKNTIMFTSQPRMFTRENTPVTHDDEDSRYTVLT